MFKAFDWYVGQLRLNCLRIFARILNVKREPYRKSGGGEGRAGEQHKPFTRVVSVSIMSRKDSQCRKVHNKFAICIEKLFGFVATQSQMPGLIYWGHFKCWPCEQPLCHKGRGRGCVWSCSTLSAGNLFVFCIKKFVEPKVETRVVHIVVSHCQRDLPPPPHSLSPSASCICLCVHLCAFSLSFGPVWLHLLCTRCGKFVCYANWWQPKID